MKFLLLVLCLAFHSSSEAQQTSWQPSAGHPQLPIWPGRAPDSQPVAGPEKVEIAGKDSLIAGRTVVGVSNVTRPTMTVYSPKGEIPVQR